MGNILLVFYQIQRITYIVLFNVSFHFKKRDLFLLIVGFINWFTDISGLTVTSL
jgi:hypothetical protein